MASRNELPYDGWRLSAGDFTVYVTRQGGYVAEAASSHPIAVSIRKAHGKQLDLSRVSDAEEILSKPNPMSHPKIDNQAHLRHYGRLLTEVFEKLKTMPEGAERDELVRQTANQMKRDLATWGHGSIDDEKVADDLARFTDGKIQIDLNTFRFEKEQTAKAKSKKTRK